MAAKSHNFTVEAHSTWAVDMRINPDGPLFDLTGYRAIMHVRSPGSSRRILTELSTDNGRIAYPHPEAGIMRILLTPQETARLDWVNAEYDLVIVAPNGFAMRLIEGTITVKPAVARWAQ